MENVLDEPISDFFPGNFSWHGRMRICQLQSHPMRTPVITPAKRRSLDPNDESWLVELSWSVGVQTLRLRIALRTMTPLRAKERTAASAAINRSAALR